MSRFTSLYFRTPRPKVRQSESHGEPCPGTREIECPKEAADVGHTQGFFGFMSLTSGMELITSIALFNGVVIILIGLAGLFAMQSATDSPPLLLETAFLYTMVSVAAMLYLRRHIWRKGPAECLALAWLYILDTAFYTFCTVVFWARCPAANGKSSDNRGANTDEGAAFEWFTIAVLLAGISTLRVYFMFVTMAFAREVVQGRIQRLVIGGASDVLDSKDGPFMLNLPDGQGWRGKLGRGLLFLGRGYFLDHSRTEWTKDPHAGEAELA